MVGDVFFIRGSCNLGRVSRFRTRLWGVVSMSIVDETLERIRDFPQKLAPLREELLANVVLIGQLSAPTGGETQRAQFVLDRFVESGVDEVSADDLGNAVGLKYGKRGQRTIMLVSHLDTIFPSSVDHNIVVQTDTIAGPGVGDNALGAAVISMMPDVLKTLNIELDSNLALVGSVRSLGRGNHEGIRYQLDHLARPIDYGIVVEGIQLGRLNYFSIGTIRGDITCTVRPEPSRSYGSENALVVLNHIINRILNIATPKRPYTLIRLGKMRAGVSYDTDPDLAELGFEVISHSDEMIDQVRREIEDIVAEMSARHAVDAKLDIFFSRQAGGIAFSHPLVKTVLDVMSYLEIPPDQGHSPSELSEFISRGIPAVTLGVTRGEKNTKEPDYVEIAPILTGVAQLAGVLLAVDRGAYDET